MGRLSEYEYEDRRAILGDATPEEEVAEQFWRDAELGKKVRERFSSPHASTEFILAGAIGGPAAAWDWLRRELLGEPAEKPTEVTGEEWLPSGSAEGEAEAMFRALYSTPEERKLRWDREALVDFFEQNCVDTEDDGQALPWIAFERLVEKLEGGDGD